MTRPKDGHQKGATSPRRLLHLGIALEKIQHGAYRSDQSSRRSFRSRSVQVYPVTGRELPTMSPERVSASSRRWTGVFLRAVLVAASIFLMAVGLWRSMFILGYQPVPGLEEDARVGSLYILAGSAASLAGAAWSFLRGDPYWVTACVAAPVIVVGGVALMWPYSMLRHLVALLALPNAMAGIIGGLVDHGYGRTR